MRRSCVTEIFASMSLLGGCKKGRLAQQLWALSSDMRCRAQLVTKENLTSQFLDQQA
jgi:hypothetical protein